MPAKLPLIEFGPFVDWLRHRDEQRAMMKAMDGLSQSRDEMLRDIGISRDDKRG
jgi:hypothetical protein